MHVGDTIAVAECSLWTLLLVTVRTGIGEVIKGWDVGVAGMRVGDKRKLTIPPEMAYGKDKMGSIPPNSTLEFEVELVDVK